MLNKKLKKIILIDKINSNYIEQAIFILKNNKKIENQNNIIEEAYNIINKQEALLNSQMPNKKTAFKKKFKQFLKAFWF